MTLATRRMALMLLAMGLLAAGCGGSASDERMDALSERIDALAERIEVLDERVDSLDARADQLEEPPQGDDTSTGSDTGEPVTTATADDGGDEAGGVDPSDPKPTIEVVGLDTAEVALDGSQPVLFDGSVKVEYTTYDGVPTLIAHTFELENRQCEWRGGFQTFQAGVVATERDPERAFLFVIESIDGNTVTFSVGDYRGEIGSVLEGDCTRLGVLSSSNPSPAWSSGQGPG